MAAVKSNGKYTWVWIAASTFDEKEGQKSLCILTLPSEYCCQNLKVCDDDILI
jgi:hypothetical protein